MFKCFLQKLDLDRMQRGGVLDAVLLHWVNQLVALLHSVL